MVAKDSKQQPDINNKSFRITDCSNVRRAPDRPAEPITTTFRYAKGGNSFSLRVKDKDEMEGPTPEIFLMRCLCVFFSKCQEVVTLAVCWLLEKHFV